MIKIQYVYCCEMDSGGLSLHCFFPFPVTECEMREREREKSLKEQETELARAESILLVCLVR